MIVKNQFHDEISHFICVLSHFRTRAMNLPESQIPHGMPQYTFFMTTKKVI